MNNSGNKRQLGLLDIFCIATGAMISSGLFVLPGIASAKTGPALFLSYIIASIIAVPTMYSKAELVTAMPKAGGDYFYISRSMGLAFGTIGGLSSWFSLSLKSTFALIGMAAYVELIAPIPLKPLAIILCVGFIILNLIGIKEAAKTQVILVLGLLGTLIFYITVGFPHIHIEKFIPFAPHGFGPVLSTAGLVFISYGGLTKIASVAEEVKDPSRNIPLGMTLSLIIVGIIYALVVFITSGLLPAESLGRSLTPISDAAYVFSGNGGKIIMAAAALLAFISTANAGIMSSSRYPMAMARDGLLPGFIQKINRRFNTPAYSIVITGAFMILAILFLELEVLVKVASALLILLYILANLSVIIMRESRLQNYQPKFLSPLYPWIQILGIIGGLFLLMEMGRFILTLSGLFIAVGLIWYFLYVGTRHLHEFALIHVIERILDRELTSGRLSKELKDIIKERDNIVEDRFDHLIKDAVVLDIEGPVAMDDFLNEAANALGPVLETDAAELLKLFLKREHESSTVIREKLAIPHIIIKGEKRFKILIARSKKGIMFHPDTPVHTAFVLAGTKDERNFYLRALSAIAQICQQADFDKNWMNARNKEELKDIVLLAERRRFAEE